MKGRILFLFTIFAFVVNIQAQILEPVKWQFSSNKISDTEYELVFTADIEQHWHLYSQDIPMAPPATTFIFEEGDGFELVGKVTEESKVIEEFDPNFDMVLKYFAYKAVFKQKVKLLSEGAVVKGYLNYMCCDDTKCLPPTDVDYSFALGAVASTNQAAVIESDTVEDESSMDTADILGKNSSLWGFFILSFIGGLAAILTPCVFPMIPMTVSFFMKDGEDKKKGKMQALLYGFSIIAIYTFIGSVLAVVAGPNIANWLSTHWLPNVLFFLIFVIFAFSFFGMFEIVLPSWAVNKSDEGADKGGFMGPVFMALTLVLVSFSCTGPIVGTILVESAGGQVLKPIIGMFGFSLAFALPFTMFAFFPSLLQGLPKSGGWLNSVKVVLGFLELALGLKFLSIADQTYHWGLLDREVYLAIWIVIFFLLGAYLLGKIKFAHDSDVPFVSVPRLMLSIFVFSFVVYMIPGMWGAPLKALSGYIPPQSTHDFDLNNVIRENVKAYAGSGGGAEVAEICETPKYHDFLHLPHGLEGYFDYEQAISCAKEQNKPIFIDFTGHGCVNCREMEANVWSDPKVLKKLREDYIVLALYVDDKTKLPKDEWITSDYDGKVKKTVGKKYADLQITKFNVNAQPFYVLMSADGDVLTQPRAYDLDIDAFIQFLDKGVENFKAGKNVFKIK
ncbi:MAG: disulfide bond formation protein DsbD [Bacteroidetes bacterium]|nr:MAG: disulfide bond formation protein DsbD [Bacteroidota bacterium]